ncbi:MAG: hypothetical protein VX589_07145 [Myxococcota bacterium]|nr:hypothetical protein [Myxococcota bacterium]
MNFHLYKPFVAGCLCFVLGCVPTDSDDGSNRSSGGTTNDAAGSSSAGKQSAGEQSAGQQSAGEPSSGGDAASKGGDVSSQGGASGAGQTAPLTAGASTGGQANSAGQTSGGMRTATDRGGNDSTMNSQDDGNDGDAVMPDEGAMGGGPTPENLFSAAGGSIDITPTPIQPDSDDGESVDVPPNLSMEASVDACTAWRSCAFLCAEAQRADDDAANACLDTCRVNHAVGQAIDNAVWQCAQENQCVSQLTGVVREDCLFDACLPEVEACFGEIALPEGDGTCNDYLACLQACEESDSACQDACLENTSRQSYGLYEGVVECVERNGCRGGDGRLNTDCFNVNCADRWDECLLDGRTFGTDSCGDVYECFWDCNLMDGACQERCLDRGSRLGWTAFREYLACASDAACRNQGDCDDACPQEASACLEQMTGGGLDADDGDEFDLIPDLPSGGAVMNAGDIDELSAQASVQACTGWLDCVNICPEAQGPNDAVAQQCYQQCSNGNPLGAQVYNRWVLCARRNLCISNLTNQVDQDCLFDACLDEVEACFGYIARPNGDGSCSEFLGCTNDCPSGNQVCRDTCIENTSAPSYRFYQDTITCLQDNNCWSADQLDADCFSEHCEQLWDECTYDGRVFGDGDCGSIHICFWRCELMDGACQNTCIEGGDQAAFGRFSDYITCASDAQCNTEMSCDNACPDELAECYGADTPDDVGPPVGGAAFAPSAGSIAPAAGEPAPAPSAGSVPFPAGEPASSAGEAVPQLDTIPAARGGEWWRERD